LLHGIMLSCLRAESDPVSEDGQYLDEQLGQLDP
jgi:hypothetical protein